MTQRYYILGAPKCGTTTLAHWLSQTTTVFMTAVKEPHYYALDYNQDWSPYHQTKAGYISLFDEVCPHHVAVGEASTNYLNSSVAVRNILVDHPDAKFIVCLRNPSQIARSLHAHHVFHGHDDIQSFEKAWNMQERRKKGEGVPYWTPNPRSLLYKDMCSVGSQVERLLSLVPLDRVHFTFLDDIASDPEAVYRGLGEFLGFEPEDIDFSAKNVTKSRRFHRFHISACQIRFDGKPTSNILYKFSWAINKFLNTSSKKPSNRISPEFEQYLLEEFDSEVLKLQNITGRDLSSWRPNL